MSAAEERRRAVARAIAAIHGHAFVPHVMAFHVRHFGIDECVTDASLDTIRRDLRWLAERGYVQQTAGGTGSRPAEYEPTQIGQQWAGGPPMDAR